MHIHHIGFLHIVVNTRFYIYILSLLFRSPQLIVCLNVLPTLPVHHTYPCTSQCIMQDVFFVFFYQRIRRAVRIALLLALSKDGGLESSLPTL